jgi:hypothetical protein
MEPLSDIQVENWRRALLLVFGSYALIMPREQIEALREKFVVYAEGMRYDQSQQTK